MWALLKKTDIEKAKQELKLRRAEALRRHSDECQNLDTDRAELETLNRLIDLFAQKFKKPPILSPAPIPAPVSTQKIADKTSPEARHQHHRDRHQHQHQTVFATFMRAATRG